MAEGNTQTPPEVRKTEPVVTPQLPETEVVADKPIGPGEPVTLSAEEFQLMMQRLAKLEFEQDLRSKVDDKNTANKIESMRRAGKLVKSVKIRRVNGKFVRAWKSVKDDVYKDQDGKLIENQIVGVYLMEDGKDDTYLEMPLRQWAVIPEYVSCEVTREAREADGTLYLTVRTQEGQEFPINVTYVN